MARSALLLFAAASAVLLAIPGSCGTAMYPFALPTRDYASNAMEPYIDNATMYLHYAKHHGSAVASLNAALANCTSAQNSTIYDLLANLGDTSVVCESLATIIRNNAGSHFNHAMYWKTMLPIEQANATAPSTLLQAKIDKVFNSTANLCTQLYAAGMARFGSGWAWLGVRPGGKFVIYSTPNQDNSLMPKSIAGPDAKTIPILGVDVWEHSYYLKWQNLRGPYINNWWKLINWDVVSKNFELAVKNKFNDDIWA